MLMDDSEHGYSNLLVKGTENHVVNLRMTWEATLQSSANALVLEVAGAAVLSTVQLVTYL
jgi:hypothetical protein